MLACPPYLGLASHKQRCNFGQMAAIGHHQGLDRNPFHNREYHHYSHRLLELGMQQCSRLTQLSKRLNYRQRLRRRLQLNIHTHLKRAWLS